MHGLNNYLFKVFAIKKYINLEKNIGILRRRRTIGY